MQNKNCQNCKKDFLIRGEDQIFYDQVHSPLPDYCPDCRMARRLSFRNERTFYKRPCDLCKKDGISIYPVGTTFPAYCHNCWWSDGWDPKSYAMEYDSSRPFIEQFGELLARVPRIKLNIVGSNVRCDYTNNSGDNKDCYLIFAAENNEDCMYGRLVQHCKGCVDCAFIYDSEKCYECIDGRKLYNCMFAEQCQSSTDLLFCLDCRDSSSAIFCTNGRHLSYSIENQPCTKEEFEKKKAEIFATRESLEEAKKKFEKMKAGSIVKYAVQTKCHDVTGNYIFNCYEGVKVFDTSNAKNCSYMADTEDPIDCMDCNNSYYKPERCYDMMGILQSNRAKHSTYIFYSTDIEYSDFCYNSSDMFGCAGIRKGDHMILNMQYPKESFDKLRIEIIESMKKDGTYGQFIPPVISPVSYNETLAQEYFPLTKEEALAKGFKWQDETTGTYKKETIKKGEVPNLIQKVDENILNEILVCEECEKNFKIVKSELDFYKRMNIPLPTKDFECRHKARMSKRASRKLWHRSCACGIERHGHTNICPNEFETAYSPDRPEKVFCEKCYQQEVS